MAVDAVAGYNRVGDEVQRALRREHIFRDRLNPLDAFDDVDLYNRYRFDWESIMWIVEKKNLPTNLFQKCCVIRMKGVFCFA